MTLPTKASVLAAIDTLTTSYSYERNQWMDAYMALREVEREFPAQLKPFNWIANAFAFAGIACVIALLVLGFTRIGAEPIFSNTWLDGLVPVLIIYVPASLMWLGGWLRLRLAARRHPMLLLKPQIESSLDRYRELAVPSTPEKHA